MAPSAGLAVCLQLAHSDVGAASKAAAIAASAASAVWLGMPHVQNMGNPFTAKALEAAIPADGRPLRGSCPMGYGVSQDTAIYKVRRCKECLKHTADQSHRANSAFVPLQTYPIKLRSIASTFQPWNLIWVFVKK